MKPTLVIQATGMARRYSGKKQADSFEPTNEAILEYSAWDAIYKVFGKICFIV